MSSPAPEKVFPAPAGAPSPAPAGGGLSLGRFRVDKKTAAIGGGLVVVLLGLLASSRNSSADAADNADLETADLDTSTTDLASQLDELTDAVNDLGDRPRPPKPGQANGGKGHGTKPGPRPTYPGHGTQTYRVAKGDTLASIAKRYGTNRARIYLVNRAAIEGAAHAHGLKSSQGGRKLFPGTVLTVPAGK